jgi:hypothetical protein
MYKNKQTFLSHDFVDCLWDAELLLAAGTFHTRLAFTPTTFRLQEIRFRDGSPSTSHVVSISLLSASSSSARFRFFTAGCVLVVLAVDDGPTLYPRAVLSASSRKSAVCLGKSWAGTQWNSTWAACIFEVLATSTEL